MREAVAAHVHDGDTVVIEGFTHLICFAAGHEIIRQRRRDLTLCRLTPDLIYDQMIAAGCARKLVFSWAGNPGAGSLHAFRRAVEGKSGPRSSSRSTPTSAWWGASARAPRGCPSGPCGTTWAPTCPAANPRIATVECPYTGERLATVPALNPDVTIVHAQRADAQGNTQIWGLLGVQKEAAFASRRVIVVVEELVDERVIRADPNRTLIPGLVVDAVVVEPWGAHPVVRPGLLRPRQRVLRRVGDDLARSGGAGAVSRRVRARREGPGGVRRARAVGSSGSGRTRGCARG